MEEENSKKMDVSYGVEKPEESAELAPKPKKKTKKKLVKKKPVVKEEIKAEEPKKERNLIEQINEMKATMRLILQSSEKKWRSSRKFLA